MQLLKIWGYILATANLTFSDELADRYWKLKANDRTLTWPKVLERGVKELEYDQKRNENRRKKREVKQ